MMEIQRHTSDTEHPMYEIIDNALSAVDGYYCVTLNCDFRYTLQIHFLLVFHPECLQEQQSL